ncbi:SDR family NAD(P)-dependent oxidoreductase [Marinactinospora rubrisoli]|uniref:SDR family NAD(P)-dependent oxidoreductase n=1 Tax=Marinactinospora rubrisoli TaxID=2715399 RepID=A0ABW2KBJ5_9ACTN
MSGTATPIPVRSPLPTALADSTAVIIGGSSGIGLAAGILLREVGARVVLVGRDQARLDAAVARVRGDGPADAVIGASADVADEDALAEIFDRAGSVDHVLVTAGGFAGGGPVGEISVDDLHSTFDNRIWGALIAARLAATRLPAGGSITLTSGTMLVRPVPGTSGLLAVAGGVETMTRALAVEFAPRRLRVNTVRYGPFDTPLLRDRLELDSDTAAAEHGAKTLLGRLGDPAEAGASALFLMANNYVTGQVITVDGGHTLL